MADRSADGLVVSAHVGGLFFKIAVERLLQTLPTVVFGDWGDLCPTLAEGSCGGVLCSPMADVDSVSCGITCNVICNTLFYSMGRNYCMDSHDGCGSAASIWLSEY